MRKKSALIMIMMMLICLPVITSASAVEYVETPVSKETVTAYISNLEQQAGHLVIDADEIQWYEGDAAKVVFLEREQDTGDLEGPPDGYYITNDSVEEVAYDVSEQVEVLLQIYDRDGTYEGMDIVWNESVTLDEFKTIFENSDLIDLSQFPYHLSIQDGVVVQIIQQFVP
ncbi:hypothetical protein [Paenibacillus crassostreae]|uniref:Uncharacterized protein n=1 Tax=Paenibacillus crassostreae TaxID=1763538 RepID=A0A167FRF7_9BACL|nr:hypothetical protein [Paenibacillus crassostreae]AOZ94138.1 hypothetical protein LPB68_19385 [Paenibacillus crassostreae]OAB76826.1 hypothetical protein PNBC_05355 [Paenibacillus crassostreae]